MSTSETMMYVWDTLPWRKLERNVYRLQKRIYQASRQGNREAVHKLQRLLIHSRSAVFIAVRRATQDNQGKKSAGVDGIASLTNRQKYQLAMEIINRPLTDKAFPVRRVWIPKPGKDEKRPLGIPVMTDRARQALAKMALEPEWEAKFEPDSYGFRPGRSCHDAVRTIYQNMFAEAKYVLDADISGCFDHINHKALLDKLDSFPALRRSVRAWLRAGISEDGKLFPTTEGTPQGGIISPLLANIALHGLATEIENAFPKRKYLKGNKGSNIRWRPAIIRYADDFVILHKDPNVLKEAQVIAKQWLANMGLEMKPSKTRITHTIKEVDGPIGFDFLGFNFRQYPRGKSRCSRGPGGRQIGFSTNVKPSKDSQKQFQTKIREVIRRHRNAPQISLISALNRIIRGWGNYFSASVSGKIFSNMDNLIYEKLWAWAKYRHPNKSRGWIARKYWLLQSRGWRFGVRDNMTLLNLSEIPSRRHFPVRKHQSPYDGDAVYWSTRLGRHPEMPRSYARLLKQQKGCCTICGCFFKTGDAFRVLRSSEDKKSKTLRNAMLIHKHCQRLPDAKYVMTKHRFIEEPYEGKPSRTVLKTSANREVCA
jgi:RNA-directed DNA polymerase